MVNLYVAQMRIGKKEYLGVGRIDERYPLEKMRFLFPDGTKRGIIVLFSNELVQVLSSKGWWLGRGKANYEGTEKIKLRSSMKSRENWPFGLYGTNIFQYYSIEITVNLKQDLLAEKTMYENWAKKLGIPEIKK